VEQAVLTNDRADDFIKSLWNFMSVILTAVEGMSIICTIKSFTGGGVFIMEDSDSCADPNQKNNLNE